MRSNLERSSSFRRYYVYFCLSSVGRFVLFLSVLNQRFPTDLYRELFSGVDDETEDVDCHESQCHQCHGNQGEEAEGVNAIALPW